MTYTQGQRVRTPLGLGRVAYQRLAPPDYRTAEVVSVVLDSERTRVGYQGTILLAMTVEPLTDERCADELEHPGGDARNATRCTAGKDHIGAHRNGQRSWS
jgi:hypothetical protein